MTDNSTKSSEQGIGTDEAWDSQQDDKKDSLDDVNEIKVIQELSDDDFPDGGLRAWLNVLGALSIGTATFGFVNSYVRIFTSAKYFIPTYDLHRGSVYFGQV